MKFILNESFPKLGQSCECRFDFSDIGMNSFEEDFGKNRVES